MIIPIIFTLSKFFGIVFTYTSSVPIGFYRIIKDQKPIEIGDIISFCLPDAIAVEGLSRGYLNHDTCANGSEPLMKEVIVVPGDEVIVTNNEIKVIHQNMLSVYQTPTHVVDKHHLLVKRFIKNGIYTATGYWVYGFGNPTYSWDSRYYGEIPAAIVTHRLMPLLVWHFSG